MRILALDPATKCGWALSPPLSGTWDLSIRRDESAGMRLIRFRSKLRELYENEGFEMVAYEAARNAKQSMQGALVTQATIQGVLVAWCEDNGVEYRGYSPSEIKKHATGKGNSGKDLVVAAAKEKWLGIDIVDDNQADALWLLDMAQKEYCN